MKDMMGHEIKVCDEIVYTSSPHKHPKLTVGRVIEVKEESVKVFRMHVGGYNGVVHGVRQKFVWNKETNTGERVPTKARATTITRSERCYVIETT
jgi:hypothetical protein